MLPPPPLLPSTKTATSIGEVDDVAAAAAIAAAVVEAARDLALRHWVWWESGRPFSRRAPRARPSRTRRRRKKGAQLIRSTIRVTRQAR